MQISLVDKPIADINWDKCHIVVEKYEGPTNQPSWMI